MIKNKGLTIKLNILEKMLEGFLKFINSKHFWRGLALIVVIGFFFIMMFTDTFCDVKKKTCSSETKIVDYKKARD